MTVSSMNCLLHIVPQQEEPSAPCTSVRSDNRSEDFILLPNGSQGTVGYDRFLFSTVARLTESHLHQTKIVTQSFKPAVIKTLPKKSTLDQEILANYRPMSSLPFRSKIPEKIEAYQLFSFELNKEITGRVLALFLRECDVPCGRRFGFWLDCRLDRALRGCDPLSLAEPLALAICCSPGYCWAGLLARSTITSIIRALIEW
ncbi:unnamed protein product [Pleuronectes platessa]|uniref:Uncharacterized protein n=1 Tax=Pleuronectes platessa TaxID=8262 RepID=A0A9N7UEH5_PLEPL|nr:unnamed protein product [Pleuronectes platessa]